MTRRTGGLIAVSLLIVAGSVGRAFAESPQPKPQVSSGGNGRYQIVINTSIRADTFLLDTQTGRVWQLTQYSFLKGNPTAWAYMDRLDNDEQMARWVKQFERVEQPQPQPQP